MKGTTVNKQSINTILAHAGLNKSNDKGAISTPIYQTATFRHPALGQSTGFDYSRSSNPTRLALEEALARLENGDRAFAFSSGLAAISAVLMTFKSGDHIVLSEDLYGGTYRLLEKIFSGFGISASFVDGTDLKTVKAAIRPEITKAIFVETPSNPVMKIADIAGLAKLAHEKGMLLIVDNTLMSPFLQRPITLGADIVVHSGSKFLSGHNDVVAGIAVASSKQLSEKLAFVQNAAGAILGPQDSWLMLRGLKTLGIRMERAESNTLKIIKRLAKNRHVKAIHHPSTTDTASIKIHSRQAAGYGAIFSFSVDSKELAEKIINGVKLISFAESLGGVETLITYPLKQTHGDVPEKIRKKLGIDETLLRLSVGIEDADDLIADLLQAIGK